MAHPDPELLALLALGEDAASAEDRLHLAGCAECRDEVARLGRAVAAARGGDEALETPGPRVWAGIAADVGVDAPDPLADARPAPAVPLRRRPPSRRRRIVAALAAAAAVLVIGGVGVTLLRTNPPSQQLETARLRAFPAWAGASGTAQLERLASGRLALRIQTDVPPDRSTDHEVWLMTAGARRLVSLGMLHGTSGVFLVPEGLDITRFRLVDVSDEPRDGNPAHSGDSIVRGELRA
ncbi:anti-sigma factor [Amnibacterium kyonggiense]|uniref:Anti-sigma-K factor rskA n=1 Tax=Amnibacterium kyonggiense TaxID=595671 RepID=A0A4R7FLD8_9MICO|nr:anti-sigma factor [Amnibacterium kyonggiense]TDS77196.1 anti-sigma-K factor rskA [Amnibacterium kyonggiense]